MKILYFVAICCVLKSINTCAMELQVVRNNFAQEQEFHQRLRQTHPEYLRGSTIAYYKRITPITSTPNPGINRWRHKKVSIAGTCINPDAKGIFTHQNISFSVDWVNNLDLAKPIILTVMQNGRPVEVNFNQTPTMVPVLPRFESYNQLITDARNNRLYCIQQITLTGFLNVAGENPITILIEIENENRQPITIRGIQLVCNKSKRATYIFLDFNDISNQPLDYFNPIRLGNTELTSPLKGLCIREHKFYDCTVKKYYLFYPQEVRNAWIPDATNFYDQNQGVLTILPDHYTDLEDRQEALKQPITWVLNEGLSSLYTLDSAEILQDTNDYIYCVEGKFYSTLPYKATYKDVLNGQRTEFVYFVQVTNPHFLIDRKESIVNGHRDWAPGLYKRTRTDRDTTWQRIGSQETIEFVDRKAMLRAMFSKQLDGPQEIIKYCNAGQRSFLYFPASIQVCDQDLANNLGRWSKITDLNLSNLKLLNGLQWKDFFTSLGLLKELSILRFENNHPVTDLNQDYIPSANIACQYYFDFATSFQKLSKLKELYIQGLWLKPQRYLGSGVQHEDSVSWEVARITGLINHANQVGVKSILNCISWLHQLSLLSIDGLPNHGSSEWSREKPGGKVAMSIGTNIFFPLLVIDGHRQKTKLKQLVIDAAKQLAAMPTLTNICVYSPGGNATDYFSTEFRTQLALARKAQTSLSPITITAEVLQ